VEKIPKGSFQNEIVIKCNQTRRITAGILTQKRVPKFMIAGPFIV
jgi:hypothetical protein